MKLREVDLNCKPRPYCGPTAVAAVTGIPVLRVIKALLRRKKEANRPKDKNPIAWREYRKWARRARIKSTGRFELEYVLHKFRRLRLQGYPLTMANPTLEQWLATAPRDGGPKPRDRYIVEVTGHWVATQGWFVCDTYSHGKVVPIDKYARPKCRVVRVYRVVALDGRRPGTRKLN